MSGETVRARISAARGINPSCIPPCTYDDNCQACDIEVELKAALNLLDESEQHVGGSSDDGSTQFYTGYRLVHDPSEPFA